MSKYKEVKILLAKQEDGSFLYNTEDGIVILIEEGDTFHRFFKRAFEKDERTDKDIIARQFFLTNTQIDGK